MAYRVTKNIEISWLDEPLLMKREKKNPKEQISERMISSPFQSVSLSLFQQQLNQLMIYMWLQGFGLQQLCPCSLTKNPLDHPVKTVPHLINYIFYNISEVKDTYKLCVNKSIWPNKPDSLLIPADFCTWLWFYQNRY